MSKTQAVQGSQSPDLIAERARLWSGALPFIRYLYDIVFLIGLLAALIKLRNGHIPDPYQLVMLLAALFHAFIYALTQIYSNPANNTWSLQAVMRLLVSWTFVLLILLVVGFTSKTTDYYSRQVFLQWMLLTPFFQLCVLWWVSRFKQKLSQITSESNRAVIIGTGAHAMALGSGLDNGDVSEILIGYIDVDGTAMIQEPEIEPSTIRAPILGELGSLRRILQTHRIKKVYIALGASNSAKVEQIQFQLLDLNVDLIWVPEIRAYNLINHCVYSIGDLPAVAINQSPLTTPGPGPLYKWILDYSVALMALIMLSPVMITAALMVKLTSPGPILFRQQRHGFDGSIIEIWKFRSMYVHTQGENIEQAHKSDPRVTPVGRWLRSSSIDELPQLFNVLQGRMSLVGPRPHAIAHNDFYSEKINAYLQRHRMKPGITGLAQVSGHRGETQTIEKMQKRVEFDLAYINNWSIWLDIKILLKTPFCLIFDEAY